VAVNCWVVPKANEGSTGVTAMDTKAAGEMSRFVEPLMEPLAAVTVVLPADTLVANPPTLIVAMLELPVLHVAVPLKS